MFAEVLNDEFLLAAAQRTRLNLEKVLERWEQRERSDDEPLAYFSAQKTDDGLLAYFAAEDIDDGPLVEVFAKDIHDRSLLEVFAEDIHDGSLVKVFAEDIRGVIDELHRACRELESERDRESAWMCIPSIPILAILQSELTSLLEQRRTAFAELDDDIVGSRIGEDIAQLPGGMVVMGLFGPKEPSDPGWLWMRVVKAWYWFKHKVTFGGLPVQPVDIADDARIVLVGDWGSGLDRARDVAGQIRLILNEGLDEGRQQHVIHLGDVYYTGSRREYEMNFLQHWPVNPGEDIDSFIVCGNHDMYRGGHDYYGTALADSRFAKQAQRSVFALRNENWQFLGLDTAYEEKRISNGQIKWIEDQLNSTHNVRTTVLSHHQLWSAYSDAGEGLRNQIGPVLEGRRIDAWFWGHEHRCLVYEPRDGVEFSSCVGHGGIPSYLIPEQHRPYPPTLRYDYRERHGNGHEPWNTFGFAVIDLDGRDMHVRYIDESGNMHHEEDL